MTYYTIEQTAKLLNKSKKTIYRWIAWGYLTSHRMAPRSPHMVSESEIKRLKGEL